MGRAPCCDKANVKKGPWSPEEDSKLKEYIEKYGTGGNWIALPQKAGLKRCGKSCRLRWLNYLRPNIKHGEFSDEEDRIILALFASIGSRWSIIAAQLPGRTDNDIKNYWNTKLKKKLMGMMIPNPNHRIIKPSPSHQMLPASTISFNHQSSPLFIPSHQAFSSPLISLCRSDNLYYPSSNLDMPNNVLSTTAATKTSSLFTGFDFSLPVSQPGLLTTNSSSTTYPTDDPSMLQYHEGNMANYIHHQYSNCSQSQVMIKQERTDNHDQNHHHLIESFITNGSEDCHHRNQWPDEEKRNEGCYGASNNISGAGGFVSSIDYDLEEVKRLIGSSNTGSGNSNFFSSIL